MEQIVMEISAEMEGAGGLGQGKLRVTTALGDDEFAQAKRKLLSDG